MAEKEKTDINLPFFKIKEDEKGTYVKVGPIEVTERESEEEKVKVGPLRVDGRGVRVERSLNSKLEGIAWATFFILIGCVFLFESVYDFDLDGVVSIGIGVILLSLNYARSRVGIEPSTFTIVAGLVLIAIGIAGRFLEDVNAIAVIAIFIGVYLIIHYGRRSF